jgi:hypothetical protein
LTVKPLASGFWGGASMPAQSLRTTLARDAREPVLLDLPSIAYSGHPLAIRLILRLDDQRIWRGRLQFQEEGAELSRETAEIFCGAKDQDLWESVRSLREHHFRDLYRSLE